MYFKFILKISLEAFLQATQALPFLTRFPKDESVETAMKQTKRGSWAAAEAQHLGGRQSRVLQVPAEVPGATLKTGGKRRVTLLQPGSYTPEGSKRVGTGAAGGLGWAGRATQE